MFNPFNFGRNPEVLELLEKPNTEIDRLLEIDSFAGQFKTNSPQLITYMDHSKYCTLISYVTKLIDSQDRNKAYKFPLMAAEILSTENPQTLEYMFRQGPIFVEEMVEEDVWTEKEVDECDSDYYSSTGSNKHIQEDFQFDDNRQNVPPLLKAHKSESQTSKKSVEEEKGGKINPEEKSIEKDISDSKVSITSDDFPFAEPSKKVVTTKQTIVKKIKKEVKPLLEELFGYFDEQMDYTLAGYTCKVLEMLLKKEPYKLRRFIFKNDWYEKMLNHVASQSVSQLVVKFLACDQDFSDFRIEALNSLLNKSLNDSETEMNLQLLSVVYQLLMKLPVCQLGVQRKLLDYFFRVQTLKKIVAAYQIAHENKLARICLIMSQYLKKMDLIHPKQKGQKWQKQLKSQMANNLQVLFKDFVSKMWEKMTEQQLSPMTRSRILEIINHLVKEDLYWSRVQLQSQNSVSKFLTNLCKKNPKNNILHCKVFELLTTIANVSDSSPNLTKNIVEEKCFSVFLLEACNHKTILYRGLAVQLCQLLKQAVSPDLLTFKTSSNKWEKIQEALHQETERHSKSLGGHGPKKSQKYAILFDKQKILKRYDYFLRGQLPDKIDQQPQELIEDLRSSCSSSNDWMDWNDFKNCNADEVND